MGPGFGWSRRLIERRRFTTAAQNLPLLVLGLFVLLGVGSSGRGQSAGSSGIAPGAGTSFAPLPSQPTGSSRCMFCHRAEVEGYARSSMAHSLRRAGQEPDGTVNANGSKITMRSSPAGYWQHWENAGDSADYRVNYVIGSGQHASGYLVDIGGHLFQSPVAFYTNRKSYDLAPGYEKQSDPDFTRPVSEECVLCHSGTALHVSGTVNAYRSPVFPAEAITCERCHGPAERHLADPRVGTIVNPAKLEPVARDSICEQCHLFGAARVPNPGKRLSDFVPGQRLEDTFTVYRNAVPPSLSAGTFKVISHIEQLALSACARNSGGRLWCGTCHDPHDKPVESLQYYRARCLSCHALSFPASHPAKDSDCLSCHMPRRNAQDGGHTVFTDHRIQRRPAASADLPADAGIAAWREPPPDLQRRNLGIAQIDVGMQRHSSAFIIQGYRALTEVQQQFKDDSDIFKWIGAALLVGKQTSDAKLAFERALQLDPDSALTEASLASPYMQERDAEGAIAHLERAVTLDPLYLPAVSTLIDLYQKQGKPAEAAALSSKIKAAMSEASASDPGTTNAFSNDSQKKAEDTFKNIQVLKGVPADQFIPAMEFMSSSLGVPCSFCHVEGHFEKDDKKPKQTARNMMKMMVALNKNNFDGRRELTCYSCHRGVSDPVDTPILAADTSSKPADANPEIQKLPFNLPTARQLIDDYIKALGGAAAIEKITTRLQTGAENFGGQSVKIEIFTQSPGKQTLVRHLPEGDSRTIFDGHGGWFVIPGRPARGMESADLEGVRMDADMQFPLHIQQFYPELRVEYPEFIEGRKTSVLYGIRQGQPAAKFCFDSHSGLLIRIVRYAESPLGLDPTQINYADYREVDGVQIPYRITLSRPGSTSTLQIDSVRQGVALDDAIFARPTP
jgi:photosynthetic reaction center cytochrome c subunit